STRRAACGCLGRTTRGERSALALVAAPPDAANGLAGAALGGSPCLDRRRGLVRLRVDLVAAARRLEMGAARLPGLQRDHHAVHNAADAARLLECARSSQTQQAGCN